MNDKKSGSKYNYFIIAIIILLMLIISIQNIPNNKYRDYENEQTQIIENNLNDLHKPTLEQDYDKYHGMNSNLHQFSKSAIKKTDGRYVLTGIGVQAIFSDTIIFNIGDRSVQMNFDTAHELVPQYSVTLDVNIPGSEYIEYRNIYDGIDLIFSINDGVLKSNYVVRSIDTLKNLKISYSTDNVIEPLSIDNKELKVGNLWKENGLILKKVSGDTIPYPIDFKITSNQYCFTTDYDKTPFIIDPNYSFFNFVSVLGGSNDEVEYDIVIDSENNTYITGYTESSDFPTKNAYDSTYNGNDIFIASFSSNGSLRWSTFFGGSDYDFGNSIAIDTNNNVYITGYTYSSDFPTLNAYDSTYNGNKDAFIISFLSNGSLRWSTYFGGSDLDKGNSIAIDSNNNVYITGDSLSSDFPTLNAYDSTNNGNGDTFIASLNSDGNLRWSTFFGGSSYDYGNGIAIGLDNNVYVIGTTYSSDFPTSNAYDSTFNGNKDAFVMSFTSTGSLRWSTYLGGSDDDNGKNIAIDLNNNIYITGYTKSSDFPTLNAYDITFNSQLDAFVAGFTPIGTIRWSTYLGGSNIDEGFDITTDSDNNVYVIGNTYSTNISTKNTYNSTYNDNEDLIVISFTSDGSMKWSTYIGSSFKEYGHGIAIGSDKNIYVTGVTYSSEFPILNGYNNTYAGGSDVFVLSIMNPLLDKDGDGMPNLYEYQNGLLLDTNDANDDNDGDGIPNLYEYLNGLLADTNDSNEDMDSDGMSNLYEYQNGLLVGIDDANGDKDGDGLINLEEYNIGTMANNTDTDGDGMSDAYEVEHLLDPLTNDTNGDKDNDGLINIEEYYISTNPNNNDTDGDGMPDGYEVNNSLYPLIDDANGDKDGDGLSNLEEYNIRTSANNPDTDGDGMSDAYEVSNSLDPLTNDANEDKDVDGLTNIEEYNLGTNPNNSDTDGDGMPDGYEVNNSLNPLIDDANGDIDNDGLTNIEEYNLGTNPNNPDTDADSMPDGYEVSNSLDPLTNDADGDKDEDGLTNLEECNIGTKANNTDTDADGIPDTYEVDNSLYPLANDAEGDKDGDGLTNLEEYNLGTNPNNSDTDNDGLSDAYEVKHSLDPFNPDTDGDGDRDGYEVEHYLDPLDPKSNSKIRNLEIAIGLTVFVLITSITAYIKKHSKK